MAERRLGRVFDETAAPFQVWDNVIPDPAAYREAALAQPFGDFVAAPGVVFHGIAPAGPQLPAILAERAPGHQPTLTFFRQSPAGQREPNWIHCDRDMGDWTAILYVTADPPPEDGTTFWRRRTTGARGSVATTPDAYHREALAFRDDALWEPWQTVQARLNRLVLFQAALFHSRAIVENYGAGRDARLIQVVFGTLQERDTWV